MLNKQMNEMKTVQDWEAEFSKGLAILRRRYLYTCAYICVIIIIIIIKDDMNLRSRRPRNWKEEEDGWKSCKQSTHLLILKN